MTSGLLLAALLAQAPSAPAIRAVPPLQSGKILIVPFETPVSDGGAYWLGDAAALLVADDVNARGLGAIARRARTRAYDQLHLPPNTRLSEATVIKVGQIVGASEVVVGRVQVTGTELTLGARAIHLEAGSADAEAVERGQLSDLFAIARRVAQKVVPGGADVQPVHAPPLQAFEQYVKGLLAEQPGTQASFLESALKADPRYDAARLALWDVRDGQGNAAAALAALKGIEPTSPFARGARFRSGISQLELEKFDDAFATFKALLEERPDAAVLNDLGVVQIRRGSSPETGKPAYYFTKAVDAQPDDSDLLFNLGYAYALDRDPQAAIYWLRETVRRTPTDADAHFVLAAELDAAGNTVEAGRERALATQLSAKYAARRGEPLPRGLERTRDDLEDERFTAVDHALGATARQDQRDIAQYHLDRGRRLFEQDRDRDALSELRRAVFLSPYESEAQLLIGKIYLRAGRPRDAVDALKVSIWSQDSAAAHVALGEAYLRLKDPAAARAQVQRALAIDPASEEAQKLAARIKIGG
jgi:predicted Zn-dependent protease/TolB-like protein